MREGKIIIQPGYDGVFGVVKVFAEKEIAFYKLVVLQDGEEAVKTFKSASGKAARFFDEVALGTRIKITRHGKGSETKYDFEVVGGGTKERAGEQDEDVPFE